MKKIKIFVVFLLSMIFVESDIIYAYENNDLPLQVEVLQPINVDDFQIRFYPQFKNQELAEEYLKNYYSSTIRKVTTYSNDNVDFDNKKFLETVFTAELMETEQDKEFRNYLDLYENEEKNNTINALYLDYIYESDEIKREQILYNLEEIMPIDNSKINSLLYTPQNNYSQINIFESTSEISPMLLPLIPLEPGTYSNGYNRNVAREYAHIWALHRNNEKYGYYSRHHDNCYDCWSDCANFVSQILYEGGMIQYHKAYWPIVGNIIQEHSNNWYYYDNNGSEAPSHTWGVAASFYNHWSKRTLVTNFPSMIKEMDPVSLDFTNDGDVDHTVIIYSKSSNSLAGLTYAAHSNNRLGADLSDALGTSGVWYGYIMEVAKNDGTFLN